MDCFHIKLFRIYFEKLEIPFYQTVGNHDCYPGELNAAFYAVHNPGWKPYERFELGGATFINLCGGHDGAIGPDQRAWLAQETASIPKDRTVFLMRAAISSLSEMLFTGCLWEK